MLPGCAGGRTSFVSPLPPPVSIQKNTGSKPSTRHRISEAIVMILIGREHMEDASVPTLLSLSVRIYTGKRHLTGI